MSSGLSIPAGLRRGAERVRGHRVVTVDAAPVDEFVDTFAQRPEGIVDEDR